MNSIPANRTVYWTDRGDPPLGNTVNPSPMDVAACAAPRVLLDGLQEAIGLVLDLTNPWTRAALRGCHA
jgi:hypothetical protein